MIKLLMPDIIQALRTRTWQVLIIGVALVPGACVAQNATTAVGPHAGARLKNFKESETRFVAWLNQPWVGDDSPYAAIRRRLELLFDAGRIGPLLPGYRQAYLKSPNDFQLTFQYFYALKLYTARGDVSKTFEQMQDLSDFQTSLPEETYPRTYNYTRLAEWCWDWYVQDLNLIPYAERLAQKDPTDPIALWLIPMTLASSEDPESETRAINMSEDLTKKYPAFLGWRRLLGYTCYQKWMTTKDKSYGLKAIDSYNEYLALAKPDGAYRPLAQSTIAVIERNLDTPVGAALK